MCAFYVQMIRFKAIPFALFLCLYTRHRASYKIATKVFGNIRNLIEKLFFII